MGEENISWKAGEIIYKVGESRALPTFLRKVKLKLYLIKAQDSGLLTKMRYMESYQYF